MLFELGDNVRSEKFHSAGKVVHRDDSRESEGVVLYHVRLANGDVRHFAEQELMKYDEPSAPPPGEGGDQTPPPPPGEENPRERLRSSV